MKTRQYGQGSPQVVVLHGGPGAPGSVGALAQEIGKRHSALEPFQGQGSVEGQVEELNDQIKASCTEPVTLIGHSWGAWLAYVYAATHPRRVSKLVLVGSGPFDVSYVAQMNATRAQRMPPDQEAEINRLAGAIFGGGLPEAEEKACFGQLGGIMTALDSFEAIDKNSHAVDYRPDHFKSLMPQAGQLRKSGQLVAYGKDIQCPVLAIHGDYDPHPVDGVRQPLSQVLGDFEMRVIDRCGHEPWNEVYGKETFYKTLFSFIDA